MKTLYIILSKLKSVIAGNVFFFAMLFAGILACNLMFTYVYGLVMQLYEKDKAPDIALYYSSGEQHGAKEIADKLKEYDISIDFYMSLDSENCAVGSLVDNSELEEFPIRARADADSYFYLSTGNITDINKPGTVIAPYGLGGVAVGDSITLNGREFLVVGCSGVPAFIMSQSTFEESGFKPEMASIDTPVRNINKILRMIPVLLGTGYEYENVSISGIDDATKGQLFFVLIIYLTCVMAFLFLMITIYDSSAYELNIYEMLGASRGKLLFIIGGVMFIFLAFSSLVSQILHAALYDIFFSKLNILGDFSYTVGDYAALFFITLLSVFIFVFIYIYIRVSRSTIVNSRKFIS